MIERLVKLTWLVVSLSAIFISCEEDDNVGAGFQDEQGLFSHFVLEDELQFNVSTILRNDSLITGGINASDALLVGAFADEFVGAVRAESYFQVQLTSETPDFGTGAICDSIVIQFNRTSEFDVDQGNDFQPLSIEIRELNEAFESDRNYLSTQSFDLSDVLLGDTTLVPGQIEDNIRIRLETSFGQQLIGLAQGLTTDQFLSSFNGLGITSTSTDASVIGIDMNSINTFIEIFYRNDNNTSLTYGLDLSFELNHSTFIEADRTGTEFEPLTVTGDEVISTSANNMALIQSGVGTAVFIEFNNLAEFFDTISSNTVINLAQIDLPVVPGSYDPIQNPAPFEIIINAANENGEILQNTAGENILISQDIFADFNPLTLPRETDTYEFDSDEQQYTLNFTAYFQALISDDSEEMEFANLLLNTNFITDTDNNNARVNRAVIDTENIRFRLLFSSLD